MSSDYSVVIPAFNAAATLAETIASVVAQLPAPMEVLVVDDGSTDATGEIAERFGGPVRLIRQTNAGPGAATTRGFLEVRAPLIATIDADDLWLTGKSAIQIAALESDAGLSAVFGHYREFREGKPPSPTAHAGWNRTCMMVRVEAARAVGPVIDPPGFTGEMVDWLARMREAGFRQALLPDVMALRRIHPGSLTYGRKKQNEAGYMFVVREAMKRRRAREAGEKSQRP